MIPASLVVTPELCLGDETIIGISPEGDLYFFTRSVFTYEENEDNTIEIQRWDRTTLTTLWIKEFKENRSDEWIGWTMDYTIVQVPRFTSGVYWGTHKRRTAYQIWEQIQQDPYQFLLTTLTLEVL